MTNTVKNKSPIFLPMMILFIITTILYCHDSNNLSGKWILDDKGTVTMHPVISGTFSANQSNTNPYQQIWIKDYWGHDDLLSPKSHKSWRPVCTVTYYWNRLWAGGVEEGKHSYYFHLVDRILHSIVTALVYPVTLYTFCNLSFVSPTTEATTTTNNSIRANNTYLSCIMAFLAALLFATHPIHVEAVANTTGRAEVLCALFYLWGFWVYAKVGAGVSLSSSSSSSARQNTTLFKSIIGVILVLCFTTASMLSKEHGFTLPIMAVIWDAYLGTNTSIFEVMSSVNLIQQKKKKKAPNKPTNQGQRTRICQLFLLRSILLAFGCISICLWRLQKNGESNASLNCDQNPTACELNRFYRFIQFSYIWAFNFWLLLYPSRLSPDWTGDGIPLMGEHWATDPRFPVCIVLWIVLFMYLVNAISAAFYRMKPIDVDIQLKENVTGDCKNDTDEGEMIRCDAYDCSTRTFITSFSWMLLPFLLTSNLIVYVGFVVADRTLYLPSLGYCLLLIQVLHQLMYRFTFLIHPKTKTETKQSFHHRLSKHWKFAFLYLIILIGYTVKQQAQTKRWSTSILIWEEAYRVNPGGHLSMDEYAMSLVNESRNIDAIKLYTKIHREELSDKVGYTKYIEHVKKPPSDEELKILKIKYLLGRVTNRFKYTTALGGAGQCDISAPLIAEAFDWIEQLEKDVLSMISDKNNDSDYQRDITELHGIYDNIQNNKAYFLITKSRCADTVADMAILAGNAQQLRPNMPYVLNYVLSVQGIVQNVLKMGLKLDQVKIERTLRENSQSVDIGFSLINQ